MFKDQFQILPYMYAVTYKYPYRNTISIIYLFMEIYSARITDVIKVSISESNACHPS